LTQQPFLLLICLVVIIALAILKYFRGRSSESPLTGVSEMRQTLHQILAETQTIERLLVRQRRVLNDAHKRIHAVSKGLEKRPS
jgi:hypothetical protein